MSPANDSTGVQPANTVTAMKNPSPHLLIDQTTHLNDTFRPHGRYEASLNGNLMHVEVTGPLNLEALKLYSDQVGPLMQSLAPGAQLCWLTVIHGSMMMPPDALQILIQKTKEMSESGIVKAVAHVADDSVEGRIIMSRTFASKIFEPAGMPYKLFSDVETASIWLNQQIEKPKS